MPKRELDLFERSLTRARDMMGLAASLTNTTSAVMDISDIHRAAFVQGVSAFDTFIHEEVRVRILDIFASGAPMPKALQKFKVSLASSQVALANSGSPTPGLGWLDNEIREQHALLSFQKPDKVADAVRLISDVQLWKALATHLGQQSLNGEAGDQILKRRLTLIADRRNTIAHQSDLDPTESPWFCWRLGLLDFDQGLVESPWFCWRLGLLDFDQGLVVPFCSVERGFELCGR